MIEMKQVATLGSTVEKTRSNLLVRYLEQRIAFGLVWLCAIVTVAVMLAIVGYVFYAGIKVIDIEFLTTPPRGGLSGEGGMSTTIVATLYLVALTLAVATPIGVGAAVYFVEYASDLLGKTGFMPRVVAVARFGVETLAGVPSIIFGLFGYVLFVSALKFGFSLLSAALAGACLILPVIIRTSEEALRTVPRAYREGSLALGATQWETVYKVVLPAALPGIITGIVLSVGRVISETAVFYVTFGGSYNMVTSLFSSGRTMALHLYYLAMDTRAFDKAMGTGAILVAFIVMINLSINLVSRRLTAREE
jgi:phosphate transport system permease protein